MLDERTRIGKMIDKEKAIWECIVCGYKVIAGDKPTKCIRCNDKREFAINSNLVVTK